MLVAGNWKMNTDLTGARQLASAVVSAIGNPGDVGVAICPPFISLDAVFHVVHGSPIRLGAQDMNQHESGAYTGEVSAAMLRSSGCHYVILGHSERRQYFGETDDSVNAKIRAALAARLTPIICVGELLEQRESGREQEVVEAQVRRALHGIPIHSSRDIVLAYEPVWAIGTGLTASPAQAQEMHALLRSLLRERIGDSIADKVELLYGGSVNAGNASTLFAEPDVSGGLIGGASLKAPDFAAIVDAARRA